MEDKTSGESSDWKEKVAYELAADAICEFEDGLSIRVGRGNLAIHSRYFMESFFGQQKTKIKIKGFDRASFKIFLDCLFGVKEYTLQDALLVYPIAHRYEVKDSMEKCLKILEITEANENVSRVLNLATFYQCNKLTDHVIFIIKYLFGILNFFENKEYFFALEPLAVLKLLEKVDLNSLIWTSVYQWGENYLKERNNFDIKSFFIENGILEKISLSHFESAETLIDFHLLTKEDFLCPNEILRHLHAKTLDLHKSLPDKSSWVKVNAGYRFSETIALKNSFFATPKKEQNNTTTLISFNKILPQTVLTIFEVKVRFIFREFKSNVDYGDGVHIRPAWRSDFNFFYREELQPSKLDFLFSPFSHSEEYDMEMVKNGSEKPVYKCRVGFSVLPFEVHSVEVTYSFDFPCRILKTSLVNTNKNNVDMNNLYFTSSVVISTAQE